MGFIKGIITIFCSIYTKKASMNSVDVCGVRPGFSLFATHPDVLDT